MAKPYSYDLRRKVIDAIELNGMKRCEAKEYFGISHNTINLWLQRKAETGDVRAKTRQHRGHSHSLAKLEGSIASLQSRLGNEGYVKKTPTEVVATAKAELEEAQQQLIILRSRLEWSPIRERA